MVNFQVGPFTDSEYEHIRNVLSTIARQNKFMTYKESFLHVIAYYQEEKKIKPNKNKPQLDNNLEFIPDRDYLVELYDKALHHDQTAKKELITVATDYLGYKGKTKTITDFEGVKFHVHKFIQKLEKKLENGGK